MTKRKLKDAPHQKPQHDADEHESSHYRRGEAAHWYVSSCANWRTGYELSAVLRKCREADKSAFPHVKTPFPVAIYRVPGLATRDYSIRNFAPYGVDALFCGYDDLESKGLD